jgi:hypothetical protein
MTTEDEKTVKTEDVVGTEEVREESARKVLYPETDTRDIEFLNQKVSLHALPVFYSRKIATVLKPFHKTFAENAKKASEEGALDALDMDDTTINALIDTAEILCDYYELGISKDRIEKRASVADLLGLAQHQLEVNGKSDFLLTPLRLITKLTVLVGEAADEVDKAKVNLHPNS